MPFLFTTVRKIPFSIRMVPSLWNVHIAQLVKLTKLNHLTTAKGKTSHNLISEKKKKKRKTSYFIRLSSLILDHVASPLQLSVAFLHLDVDINYCINSRIHTHLDSDGDRRHRMCVFNGTKSHTWNSHQSCRSTNTTHPWYRDNVRNTQIILQTYT